MKKLTILECGGKVYAVPGYLAFRLPLNVAAQKEFLDKMASEGPVYILNTWKGTPEK